MVLLLRRFCDNEGWSDRLWDRPSSSVLPSTQGYTHIRRCPITRRPVGFGRLSLSNVRQTIRAVQHDGAVSWDRRTTRIQHPGRPLNGQTNIRSRNVDTIALCSRFWGVWTTCPKQQHSPRLAPQNGVKTNDSFVMVTQAIFTYQKHW